MWIRLLGTLTLVFTLLGPAPARAGELAPLVAPDIGAAFAPRPPPLLLAGGDGLLPAGPFLIALAGATVGAAPTIVLAAVADDGLASAIITGLTLPAVGAAAALALFADRAFGWGLLGGAIGLPVGLIAGGALGYAVALVLTLVDWASLGFVIVVAFAGAVAGAAIGATLATSIDERHEAKRVSLLPMAPGRTRRAGLVLRLTL